MPYVYPTTVRFSQVDAAGIVFFSRVFEMAHEAFEAMLQAGGFPLEGILAQREWAAPLVHAEADYRRPMRLGDALRVEVEVASSSARRVTFGFRVVGEDGVLRAEVRHVHAFVDLATFRSVDAPASFLGAVRGAGLELPERGEGDLAQGGAGQGG